ncbi:MAG: tRNA preQ1(34) S-adenosylmethionine ribosyltransferase-isomerase QueA [Betaproteobacteria bacterium]|nr:tRNA preQ1(34) S-adenosylmethionine ribosyltransferase-isomerase QueA [Betaproteobacteria bacterium]
MTPATPERPFRLSDFDFHLPPELIAQTPAPERSASRMLDGRGPVMDRIFKDLPELLQTGDLLVFNDTQVVPARLFGEKPSGGQLELLVERVLPALPDASHQVVAHMKVSKKPAVGTVLRMFNRNGSATAFDATLLGRWPTVDGPLFRFALSGEPLALMRAHGHVPLPPYIERDKHQMNPEDVARYQTVFAKHPGAAAAPTAALHFDEALLAQLNARGVQRASVTLHVGAGTFSPVKSENLSEHRMHSEWYSIPATTLQAIADCQARGGRVVAVGTTTVRTLESWARSGLTEGDTDIFITPGFVFQVVDLLITNFHLPKSSLMMLVAAFTGFEPMHAMYAHAIAQGYRFFSYGDSMLLQRSAT